MKAALVLAGEPPGPPVQPAPRFKQTNGLSRFRVSDRSAAFLRRYYADATPENWNDWRWQDRNRIRTLTDLARMIELSDEECDAIRRHTGALPVGITPYYAGLPDPQDPHQGLRRTLVTVLGEFETSPGEDEDPFGEDSHSAVPGSVHSFPDSGQRVAFGPGECA